MKSKLADINTTISIITLNENELYNPTQRARGKIDSLQFWNDRGKEEGDRAVHSGNILPKNLHC